MKRNREEVEESAGEKSRLWANSSVANSKNVCFRVTNDETYTMEWYAFNPITPPSEEEKTETHHRCSICRLRRQHRFDKSNLTALAGLCKHWEMTSFISLGSCIYCIGGDPRDGGDPRVVQSIPRHFGFLKRVLQFDTKSSQDGWKKAPSMIKARGYPHTEVLGGKIYVLGGFSYPADEGPWAEVFDPEQTAWHALPDPPLATKSVCHIVSAALEEDKTIVVGFFSAPNNLLGSYAYHVSDKYWEKISNYDEWMDHAIYDKRALVVDRTLYWYASDKMSAYDLDQKMWYSGKVKGLRREGIIDDPDDDEDEPWLLHLDREKFCLICKTHVHKISGSLFTCICCAVFRVSKFTESNGKGILKNTLEFVKSYFVKGIGCEVEPCLIDGMLEGDDGNFQDGSAYGTTVWGEALSCACI